MAFGYGPAIPAPDFRPGRRTILSGYYSESNPNPWESEKRVDLEGAPHYNQKTKEHVPTPHAQGLSKAGGVRPATPDEIPRR